MVGRIVGRLGEKRIVVLALAGGVLALGLDSLISHFANTEDHSTPQWIPVILSPATALLLLVAAFSDPTRGLFRGLLRASGWVNVLVGLAGTYFHLKETLRHFEGEEFGWEKLRDVLAVAPPGFAPGGFAGIGLMLVLVASPRLTLAWGKPAPQPLSVAPSTPAEPPRASVG